MRSRGAVLIEADDEAIESRPMLSLSAVITRRVAEYRVARLAGKSKRGTLRSPATVNRECALLRSIIAHGARMGGAREAAHVQDGQGRGQATLFDDEDGRRAAQIVRSEVRVDLRRGDARVAEVPCSFTSGPPRMT